MKRSYILHGNRVGISFSEPDDSMWFSKWLSDIDSRRTLMMNHCTTSISHEEQYIRSIDDSTILFTIFDIETDIPIGYESIFSVNTFHQSCEIGVLIGEKEYRKDGYGFEAVQLMLKYAFEQININSIMIRTASFNYAGRALAEKLHFKLIGHRRKSLLYDHHFVDDCLYDLTFDDYCKGSVL